MWWPLPLVVLWLIGGSGGGSDGAFIGVSLRSNDTFLFSAPLYYYFLLL